MPDGHCPAMLQVTAVDGQFGTHRVHDQQIPVGVGGQEHPVAGDQAAAVPDGGGRRRCPCVVTRNTPWVSTRMMRSPRVWRMSRRVPGVQPSACTTARSATRPRQSTAASPYTAMLVRGIGTVGSGRMWRVAGDPGCGPVACPSCRRDVAGMTTGSITEPVTTPTPTAYGGAAEETPIHSVGVRSSTGTSDVAGCHESVSEGGLEPPPPSRGLAPQASASAIPPLGPFLLETSHAPLSPCDAQRG